MHPSFGRRTFQPLFERNGLAELVYTPAGVGPRVVLNRSVCALDNSGIQSEEMTDSASVYVQDPAIEPT